MNIRLSLLAAVAMLVMCCSQANAQSGARAAAPAIGSASRVAAPVISSPGNVISSPVTSSVISPAPSSVISGSSVVPSTSFAVPDSGFSSAPVTSSCCGGGVVSSPAPISYSAPISSPIVSAPVSSGCGCSAPAPAPAPAPSCCPAPAPRRTCCSAPRQRPQLSGGLFMRRNRCCGN